MRPLDRLRANIQSCFLGNQPAIDCVVTCLLARGHVLIEDVPGVGKTTLALAMARSLDVQLSRVQMTPDLLPSDILGVTVWDANRSAFDFRPGPVFANLVLADEINRTTPRTQSALLEAMSEGQVSLDGETRKLPDPFLVIATQNPFEFEGTYFLPESQLDRFLMRINLGYPSPEDEARVLTQDPRRQALNDLEPVMSADELRDLQNQCDAVRFDPALTDYVVAIANATRRSEELQLGVSPRGCLALVRAARAAALVHGRDYAVPDDITAHVVPVFAHRCISKAQLQEADQASTRRVLRGILERVPAPG